MQLHSNYTAITKNMKFFRGFKSFSESGAYNRGGAYIKSYDLRCGAYNRVGAYFRMGGMLI